MQGHTILIVSFQAYDIFRNKSPKTLPKLAFFDLATDHAPTTLHSSLKLDPVESQKPTKRKRLKRTSRISSVFVGMKRSHFAPEPSLKEYQKKARRKIARTITPQSEQIDAVDSQDDLDYLFRTTKALAATNNSIVEKCEASRVKNGDVPVYTRFIVKSATVQYPSINGCVDCSFPKNTQSKRFEVPSHLSSTLLSSLLCPKMRADIPYLVDYDDYLEKAMLVSTSILPRVLHQLKNHLEDMQVFLGEIDSWLAEPAIVDDFFESNRIHRTKIKSSNDEFTMRFSVEREAGRQKLLKFWEHLFMES